jgi:acyl carrier protein
MNENAAGEPGAPARAAGTGPQSGTEPGEARAPKTGTEKKLHEIWCRTLDLDEIGCDENFFALGGRSVQAVRLVNEVKDAFGFEVTIRTVFEAPTIASLAESIESRQASGPENGPHKKDRPKLVPRVHL